jgi:hypothetical protein
MLVDERRETVGVLRLIGLPTHRILVQIFLEGALIATAGGSSASSLARGLKGSSTASFSGGYNTALIFVKVTPDVAALCLAIAVHLARCDGGRVVGLAPARSAEAGPTMRAIGICLEEPRAPACARGTRHPRRGAVGALLFDMLLCRTASSRRCATARAERLRHPRDRHRHASGQAVR